MYKKTIYEILEKHRREDVDTRHVEAFMRLENGTLDHLSFKRFQEEVLIAVNCIDAISYEESENLAQSFGL